MGITKIDELNAPQARAYLGPNPTLPTTYYGTGIGHVDSISWRGGEICFNTNDNRLYIQTATSGTSPTWKRFADAALAL